MSQQPPPLKLLEVRFTGRLLSERCKMYSTTTHIQVVDLGRPMTQRELRTALADGNVHGFGYSVRKGSEITATDA